MYIFTKLTAVTLCTTLLVFSNLAYGIELNKIIVKLKSTHTDSELLIKFKSTNNGKQSNYSTRHIVNKLFGEISTTPLGVNEKSIQLGKSSRANKSDTWSIAHIPKGKNIEQVRKQLMADPSIEHVEYNHFISVSIEPNDPLFPEMWNLENTGQTGGRVDADIDATNAWDIHTGSKNVVVAVIDTGIDYTHPDLINNIWTNTGEIPDNGIDDDGNGYIDDSRGYDFVDLDNDPMDQHGHGTHVAGTLSAEGGNGIGITGVAWGVQLMPLRILNHNGNGTTAAAIEAIYYATKMGATISNNSWGNSQYSQALKDAIEFAGNAGSLFITAAGNDNRDIDINPSYPAAYDVDNIISVSAYNHNDTLAYFSNYAANRVDLGAPGVQILSTVPTNGNVCCSNTTGYAKLSGTSMASPHVAGAIALLASKQPALNYIQLKNKLLFSVDKIMENEGLSKTGGRLNIANILSESDDTPPDAISDLNAIDTLHRSVKISWTAVGDSGNFDSVAQYDIRFNTSLIDKNSFYSSRQATNTLVPASAGTTETYIISGLEPNTQYYFAVSAIDSSGNESGISNVISSITRQQPIATSIDYYVNEIIVTKKLSRGDAIQATDSICQNQFKGNAFIKYSSLYVSTDPTINVNDIKISSHRITTSPNACESGSYWGIMPYVSAGTYYIGSIADNSNDQPEANEFNNISPIEKIELINGMADLTAELIYTDEQVSAGQVIFVSSNVCNIGNKSARDFRYGLYISNDASITTNDTLLNSTSRMLYNEHCTGTTPQLSAVIPNNLSVGTTYYLGVISDIENNVTESDETNNGSKVFPIKISATGDDFVFTQINGPASADTGASVLLSGALCNLNSNQVPSQFGSIYLSFDSEITSSDISVGWHYNSKSNSSCTTNIYASASIPASLAPGTYYWGAIANSFGLVQESNKDNNAISGNLIVIK